MGTQKRIVFIEDEKELLDSVSQLLLDNGYGVDCFPDAETALKFLQSSTADLILADIKLPGIDGFDFFVEVKKIPRLQAIPIVFVTAFNNVQAMMYAKKIGVAEYITKPFDFEYLVARVQAHLATP